MDGHRVRIPGPHRPAAVVAGLADSGAFGDYVGYECPGGFYFAADPIARMRVSAEHLRLRSGSTETIEALPSTDVLVGCMSRFRAVLPHRPWRVFGWAAFELSRLLADDGAPAAPQASYDDTDLLHVMLPGTVVHITDAEAVVTAVERTRLAVAADIVASTGAHGVPPGVPVRIKLADSGHYRSAVAAAVAAIHAGELEKVILSRTIDLGDDVDLPATYLAGREGNTPARSFLLSLGGLQAAGFSPEIVAAVAAVGAERRVTAQPLAGTRALTGRPESDAELRSQLLTDPKEVYEHAISVRAVWDELAAVCLPDTVRVERYMAVQERGSVQHLGSLLSGRLPAADPMAAWRAFQALFPSVTATGIAKGPARRLIADLEPRPRRLYAGAVLTADHDGALDAALSLRAMYRERQRAWLQAGAGIVRQSDPEREHEETCEKLRSIADFLRERPRSA